MSKNIVIQEGGIGRQFTADKLKTAIVGGGSCNWVPEDETQLGTKHITQDGTYEATDDGYYGYSQVTVSGIGKATGTDPETGEMVNYSTNEETGEIEKHVLPTSIMITTPPTKLDYQEGDLIDYAGMVVKAYLNSGEIWTDESHPNGIIPISELTLSAKVADSTVLDEDPKGATSPYETALEQPIPYGTDGYTLVLKDGRRYVYTTTGEDTVKIFRLIRSNGATAPTLMSSSDFVVTEMEYRPDGYPSSVLTHAPNRSTIRGRPVYVCNLQGSTVISYSSTTTVDILTNAIPTDDDYYTVVYGTEVGGGYSVPVKWTSQYDGEKEFSDKFTIAISPATEPTN